MTTRPSLLEDQFVDMAFITNLTGLTGDAANLLI